MVLESDKTDTLSEEIDSGSSSCSEFVVKGGAISRAKQIELRRDGILKEETKEAAG